MLRKLITTIFILACFILQSTVFPALDFGGVIPNLMVILTSSFGFMRGDRTGLAVGFGCGLLCDIFYGGMLGFYAMIFMYVGFLNGKFSQIFYPEDIKLPLALIVTSDLTVGLVCYVLLFLLRGRFNFSFYLWKVICPEAIYTIVATLFLYPIVLKVNELLEAREKRSAQIFV